MMSVYTRTAIGLIVLLFFALVWMVVIPAYVEKPMFIPGFAPGPDMWPQTIAVVGCCIGALYVLFQLPAWKHRQPLEGGWFARTQIYWLRSFAAIAVLIGYVLLVPLLGIVPTSSLLLAVLYGFLGRPHPMAWLVGLTVAFPFLLYWLFTSITTTLFPMGTLWDGFGL